MIWFLAFRPTTVPSMCQHNYDSNFTKQWRLTRLRSSRAGIWTQCHPVSRATMGTHKHLTVKWGNEVAQLFEMKAYSNDEQDAEGTWLLDYSNRQLGIYWEIKEERGDFWSHREFKGRPETKRPSPHLENENINYPWVMAINSIKTCAIYLYLLVCALERMRLVSLELRHSLNATR